MKKKLSIIFLLTSLFSFSQSYTVLNETVGEFMTFTPIYEDSSLFGYVEMRKMNVDESNSNSIKYIVLDKNLNTICSGDLIEKTSNARRKKKIYDVNYANGFIRFDFFEYSQALGEDVAPYFKTYQVVDLKANKVVSKGIYNPNIPDIDKQYDKIDNSRYNTYSLDQSGFLIVTDHFWKYKGPPTETFEFKAVNFKNEKIWEYKSKRAFQKYTLNYSVLNYTDKYIVMKGFYSKGKKIGNKHILVLDSKTGKELFFTEVSNQYTLTTDYTSIVGDKVYIGGRFFKENKEGLYLSDESYGIYQTVYDIKTNQTVLNRYVKYEEFTDLKINKTGKVRGDGRLTFQKFSINPDGTNFVLAEAYWQKQEYRAYTHLYTFMLDKDFKPLTTTEYEVKRTKGYKYDFTQRLPNKTGRAYFFFDKNDDKDLELNILNYYFKSQKQIVQKMPISNEESTIAVFPAKEGYVGIAEYFKKPEKKGKYMEIRLEKLNYERE